MIDRQRPSRLASERAKALFLGDVSISKQLEREERDLRKAIKLSRLEAQRAKRTENESSSPQKSPPLPPTTKTTKTTATVTATTKTASQKRKMGKPKAIEIPAKIAKGCCKTINQIKSSAEKRPKSNLIIRTRSQNNNNPPNNAEYPKSTCGVNNINGISSPVAPCALQLGNGNSINGLNLLNGANCDKPRPKIMAQRKFASISYNGNTYLKPRDTDFSSMKELFTKHKPSAEDFLTFLCFRSTNLLPPHLDFYALNNITSKDSINILTNDITTDKTANETVESNSTIKSHNHQSDQSNLSTSMKTNKGPTNGKVQIRKRASVSVNCSRKTDANGRKNSKVKRKGKDNLVNGNFNVKYTELTKNIEDLKKLKTAEKKIGAGVATKACNSGRKSSSDENRPKKSSDLTYSQLKRSPNPSSTSSRHKSQTKVIVSRPKKKATNDSQDGQVSIQPISNGKVVSKRSLSQSGVSDNNSEDVKKKVKTKVTCDRILRSTRKSSSTSNKAAHHIEETCPSNERQNLITSENPVENLDTKVPIKSAINKSSVNSPKKRKRAVNNGDTTNNCRSSKVKESMASISVPTEPQQSKKNGQIKTLPSETIPPKVTIKINSSARVGTRSCTKR
uniref:Uncharacterized protein n=1 Tax=Tetranychus urticae TaxID=32264 RepID=T1KD38_TETUR